ncbi:MAG: IPT/TIG domain-containing protein [Actinobacteria bacterium]|nr:IPT/TIG domain-containing protein [Actinomycetota bacterium]MBU4390843.1 IPT/TIG domain-containing protein [Actinomycetota bacterium]MBU4401990.1 IPT/TIG domain-containing protein [Actinomycetota bacterium]MBU4441336.1 IPT/TIG domain-containing protein [Actinomycetota bacterium]
MALLVVLVAALTLLPSPVNAASLGSIVGWGRNVYGETSCPVGNDYVAVAAGSHHGLALKSDGSIVGWGCNDDGQATPPTGNDYVAVAAGDDHSLALKGDGSIVGWGLNDYGQATPPAGNDYVAVASGSYHGLALKSDGTVVAWGYNFYGQCNVPAPNSGFVQVAGGGHHSLGLKSDGTVVAWGRNGQGQCNVPAPNSGSTQVSGGGFHSLALKSDGTVVAWGYNAYGQCNVPAPNSGFVQVAGGWDYSLALKSDGSIVGWGSNMFGLIDCPAGNDYVAVSAGSWFSLAIGVLPHVDSLTPISGVVGSEVTVTGTAFGSSRGDSYVEFGSTQATEYTSWSTTKIKCKVPPGASGKEGITVTTVVGTSNSKPFSVIPSIHSIDPPSARVESDASVTISGTALGSARGDSYVEFGSTQATEYASWSDTEIRCKVPNAAIAQVGPMPVKVTTEGGKSNSLDFVGMREWYFAEGTTREGFDEWLTLQNPGENAVEVYAKYMLFGKAPVEKTYTVPPTSRVSINVNNEVGPGQDVSVMLWSEGEFYAERPMYFSYKQAVEGYGWTGGHCATGASAPRSDWYFAEGTTRDGFEEWLCIQNPNSEQVRVNVNYISAGAYTQQKQYDVEPHSRFSVFVNGDVGPGQDVSVHAQCSSPIVVERPMYFNYHGKWTGGHVIMGTDSPKTAWYFAEGSTQPGFEEWLAVQNANDKDAIITCHFLKSDGTQQVENYTVGANSRWTLDVSQAVGVGVDSAMVIESDQPVVAERPMYFSYKEDTPGYGWTGGHDVVGAKEAKASWFFAEGCTHDWADEYICVANPGAESAHVTFTFMLESGAPVEHSIDIDPGKRSTVKVADIVGRGHDVSTQVTSSKPVVAERPMYFNYNGWTGGHDVVGF